MTKLTYKNRTPDSIHKEYLEYSIDGVKTLAQYLQTWMANEHNDRQFVKLCADMLKDKMAPHEIARALFNHASDWFAYGN